MPTQKLYCYVDETGKDTLGQLFVVSVVTAKEDRAALCQRLERLEQISGKGHVKWHRTKHLARLAYIRAVLTLPLPTRALLCYEV